MTYRQLQSNLEQQLALAKQVYDGAMMLGMTTATFEAVAKIQELKDMLKAATSTADKIAELNIKRDKLCVRYDSKNKQIADLKRDYYITYRSTKNIMQSDVAEDLTNLRNSRDKIDAQIDLIDTQLEALEN